jgi:hypothetical protein
MRHFYGEEPYPQDLKIDAILNSVLPSRIAPGWGQLHTSHLLYLLCSAARQADFSSLNPPNEGEPTFAVILTCCGRLRGH